MGVVVKFATYAYRKQHITSPFRTLFDCLDDKNQNAVRMGMSVLSPLHLRHTANTASQLECQRFSLTDNIQYQDPLQLYCFHTYTEEDILGEWISSPDGLRVQNHMKDLFRKRQAPASLILLILNMFVIWRVRSSREANSVSLEPVPENIINLLCQLDEAEGQDEMCEPDEEDPHNEILLNDLAMAFRAVPAEFYRTADLFGITRLFDRSYQIANRPWRSDAYEPVREYVQERLLGKSHDEAVTSSTAVVHETINPYSRRDSTLM